MKHELIKDGSRIRPYGTNLTYPPESYVRCHQTSGTTTMPIGGSITAESWGHIVQNWVQILGAAGIQQRDRFFSLFRLGRSLILVGTGGCRAHGLLHLPGRRNVEPGSRPGDPG
jgi:phenylacetate-coenzyme A ligase PaaK-like adenylate-forming protein